MFLPRFDILLHYQSTHARLNGIFCFICCLDMGLDKILEVCSKIFMLMICVGIEEQKLVFITSFMIYAKRVRLLANLQLTRVVISQKPVNLIYAKS